MLVRLAQDEDLPAITEINDWYIARTSANFSVDPVGERAMREDWLGTRDRYPWLVAVDENLAATAPSQIVGFAKASPWKGRCAYDWSAEVTVYVQHGHHRRGVGLLLYERLFAILRDQGFCTLLAGITQPNEASVRLHEKMGMKRVGYHERVGWKFDTWHDVGHWQLALVNGESSPSTLRPVREVVSE